MMADEADNLRSERAGDAAALHEPPTASLATEVLTLGESMGSIRSEGGDLAGGRGQLSIAGSETNVAIGLARLAIE